MMIFTCGGGLRRRSLWTTSTPRSLWRLRLRLRALIMSVLWLPLGLSRIGRGILLSLLWKSSAHPDSEGICLPLGPSSIFLASGSRRIHWLLRCNAWNMHLRSILSVGHIAMPGVRRLPNPSVSVHATSTTADPLLHCEEAEPRRKRQQAIRAYVCMRNGDRVHKGIDTYIDI